MATYSSVVIQHFRGPHNVGQVEQCDGQAQVSEARLSIHMSLALSGNTIVEARFRSTSCVVSIAACSVLTDMVAGTSVADAMAITPEQVALALGGIPLELMNRCELAVQALRGAVEQARS